MCETLDFYVGGNETGRELVAPLLERLARPGGIHFVGEGIRAGYSAKLLINLLWFGQVAAVTEAMLLGRRLGITPDAFRAVLAGSAADSSFAQRHLDQLLAGDYIGTFSLQECVNELDALASLATDAGSPFALSAVVAQLHHQAPGPVRPRRRGNACRETAGGTRRLTPARHPAGVASTRPPIWCGRLAARFGATDSGPPRPLLEMSRRIAAASRRAPA